MSWNRLLPRGRALALALALAGLTAAAPGTPPAAHAAGPDIQIPMGQSFILTIPDGITRIAIGDPSLAEAITFPGNDKEIVINAKAPGLTNLLVWTARGGVQNKLLEVIGSRRTEQVVLRVKVIEFSNNDTGNAGFAWNDFFSFSEATPNMPFRLGLPVRNTNFALRINTLINDGKAKVLARPTLVALHGESASFTSGGQLPVVSTTGTGADRTSRVEWKDFGVKLLMTPRVEGADMIGLKLKAEVSTIDRENGASTQDVTIPGIGLRVAETNVVLRDGDTLAMAGLVRDESREVVHKFPLLGDVPVLGFFFRSTNYEKRSSELVFLISPTILRNPKDMVENGWGEPKPSASPGPTP